VRGAAQLIRRSKEFSKANGDPPVQESTKFEFRINLETAKGLGPKISPDLLSIANEAIE
jgi:hypothetical protein